MTTSLDKFISNKEDSTSNSRKERVKYIDKIKLTTYCCNYEQIYIPKKNGMVKIRGR